MDIRRLKQLHEPPAPWWMTPQGVSEDFIIWSLGQ